jgi:SAM-dependent methyltransferase
MRAASGKKMTEAYVDLGPELGIQNLVARLRESAERRRVSLSYRVPALSAEQASGRAEVDRVIIAQDAFSSSMLRTLRLILGELEQQHSRISAIHERLRREADERVDATRQLGEQVHGLEVLVRQIADRTGIRSSGEGKDYTLDYVAFEQQFRGSAAEIRRRQSAYVDLFRGRQNVTDLGCGRGEFLELLAEAGVPVTGIDSNQDMVDVCQARGLRVVLADLFDHLASLPDASLDGVFASQIVEHLHPSDIGRLIDLCRAKLKEGGVIVAETVNPHCPEALANFYLDPTHIRPVPPGLLRFMLEQAPFLVRSLKFSSPVPESGAEEFLETLSAPPPSMKLYRDYAVIAMRR